MNERGMQVLQIALTITMICLAALGILIYCCAEIETPCEICDVWGEKYEWKTLEVPWVVVSIATIIAFIAMTHPVEVIRIGG